MYRRGVRGEGAEDSVQGLRDLTERLKQQRQRQLDRYNLDSLMDDIDERLRVVVDTERQGIDSRLEEAHHQIAEAGHDAEDLSGPMDLQEQRAQAARDTLDSLPESTAGAIRELGRYDFMDPEARRKFDELMDLLKQRMIESHFQDMREQFGTLDGPQMEGLKEMMRAFNRMLRERAMGLEPDFPGLMERFGSYFDPDRPESLKELIERLQRQMAAAQSLMDSMPPEMSAELQSMMESAIDVDMMAELAGLSALMGAAFPLDDLAREYPFMCQESLTMDQAMELMERPQDMDAVERQPRQAMRSGNLDGIDPDMVEEHLSEDARRQLEQLQRAARELQDAGYLRREGDRLELTPRGIRKLAQQASRRCSRPSRKTVPAATRCSGAATAGSTRGRPGPTSSATPSIST